MMKFLVTAVGVLLIVPSAGAFDSLVGAPMENEGPMEIIKTCKPGDDLVVCDHHPHNPTEWVCDDVNEFHYCEVVCADTIEEETTCLGYTFSNSQVECAGVGLEVCQDANFTNSEVTCSNDHTTTIDEDAAACYGATFTYSNVVCSSKQDCLSASYEHSVVACDGEDSCFGSIEAPSEIVASVVDCSGPNSCGGFLTFIASEVACGGDGACNSEDIDMEQCCCCDGPNCPADVLSCNDVTLCSSEYMGKTCAEWGNPVCDKDSFLGAVGRNPFTGEPNVESIFDMRSSSSEDEVRVAAGDATLPKKSRDAYKIALFALLALLFCIAIVVFRFRTERKATSEDAAVRSHEGKPAYETSSEADSADEETN